MNKLFLCGRTTSDIELNATPNGKSYIMFTIACDNGKDENGEKRDADFVNCVAWGKRAEIISEYVKKGNRFSVVGSFKTDKYETSSGETRYRSYCLVSDFEFLESKSDSFVPSEPKEATVEIEEAAADNDPFKDFGEQISMDENMLD